MSHSEHSYYGIGSEGLRIIAPATALAIAVANGVRESNVSEIDAWIPIPRDPTPAEIRRFGSARIAYAALWATCIRKRITDERWDLAATDYVLEPQDFGEIDRRVHEAIALRELFSAIAEQNAARQKQDRNEIVLALPPSIDLLRSMKLRVSVDRKQARLESEGLLKALVEEGELGRIRRCAYEKCQRFFLAGRVDTPCCQKSCRNAHKQKRHREREKQNRALKKRTKKRKG